MQDNPKPSRYQSPEDDEYPRLGRLLIVLLLVMLAVGASTLAAVYFWG
ncbi:hypothetical protein [Chitinimonas sp.]